MDSMILILLVEDEELIGLSLEDVLRQGGYEVQLARRGMEAVKVLEEAGATISGLVTDIRLGPGQDGWDVARRARELNSEIAVVYMSGDSVGEYQALGVPHSAILHKPFAAAQLVTAVSHRLNKANPTPAV
ncbi:MAG: transcriptional regulator [Alphaproteobacteria bacterium]|nr:transcriptional regulator [Alphaproteobacteria bacterium]